MATVTIKVKCETASQLKEALEELAVFITIKIKEEAEYLAKLSLKEIEGCSSFSNDFDARIDKVE